MRNGILFRYALTAIPVSQSLVPLAGSFNTIISRFRRSVQSERQLLHTVRAGDTLVEALRRARQLQKPPEFRQSGNPIIDSIIRELMLEQKSARDEQKNRKTTFRMIRR